MTALLLETLTHEACDRPFQHGVATTVGAPVCVCVTKEAIEARGSERVRQAAALLEVIKKLHEIERAGQPLEIDAGGIKTPCACCAYETWNDWTDLSGAYEAAGLEE